MHSAPVSRMALVGPIPPPNGGMANQVALLRRLLTDDGIEVELVPVNAPIQPHWLAEAKGIRAFARLIPYLVHLWRAAGRNELFHMFANSGWSWHLYATPAIWIARLRGTPVIVNYRGGEARSFFEKSFRWVKPSLDRTTRLVVPSSFLQEVFSDFGVGDTALVKNIIDLSRFGNHQHEAPRDFGDAPHLIVTRNLYPLYDMPTALRAFAIVRESFPGARLSMAGEGTDLDKLKAMCGDLNLTDAVTFTGRLDNAQVAELLKDADLLLNPSTADNMPNSLLESLASGVPVVSTNVGGIPHMVSHGETALLVEPQSPQAMATEALSILQSPSLREALIENGRKHADTFTWPQVRKAWFDVYEAVLKPQ